MLQREHVAVVSAFATRDESPPGTSASLVKRFEGAPFAFLPARTGVRFVDDQLRIQRKEIFRPDRVWHHNVHYSRARYYPLSISPAELRGEGNGPNPAFKKVGKSASRPRLEAPARPR
eukprot:scaffold2119_cov264-Pinguiococcus_pyrenoidosus.AAC.12